MKKFDILLTTVAILSIVLYCKSSLATNEISCPEGSDAGSLCWQCGENCTARLDSSGNMNVFGSGAMYDFEWGQEPWSSKRSQINNINVEPGITTIGSSAFMGTSANNITIPDTVTSIGDGAFYQGIGTPRSITSLTIPASVTSIGMSVLEGTNLSTLVIPDSVTTIGTRALRNIPLDYLVIESVLSDQTPSNAFNFLNSDAIVYCKNGAHCENKGGGDVEIRTYTKDRNGIYYLTDSQGNIIDGTFWSSPENMGAGQDSACSDYEACKVAAAEYKYDKAKSMSGGSLCATNTGCLKLINMAQDGTHCSTISDCKAYGSENGILFNDPNMVKNADGSYTIYDNDDNFIGYKDKRRYTVEEALRLIKSKDNVISITW